MSISNKYRMVSTIPEGDVFDLVNQLNPAWYNNLKEMIRRHLHRESSIATIVN
ncbi:MAG: hypothetical protein WC302_03355 [Candidatus Paceibacterota bacterium]|jgi:hypothetical protein